MIQKLVNWFLRVRGWSPIGREIILLSGEGPASLLLAGAVGYVTRVEDADHSGPESIHVTLTIGLHFNEVTTDRIVLVPRHKDYDSNALANSAIAAFVFAEDAPREGRFPKEQSILAIMDVALASRYVAK